MKTQAENTKKEQQVKNVKIETAKVDFEKMMAEIKPFIRKSDIHVITTAGKWYDTTSVSDIALQGNV